MSDKDSETGAAVGSGLAGLLGFLWICSYILQKTAFGIWTSKILGYSLLSLAIALFWFVGIELVTILPWLHKFSVSAFIHVHKLFTYFCILVLVFLFYFFTKISPEANAAIQAAGL